MLILKCTWVYDPQFLSEDPEDQRWSVILLRSPWQFLIELGHEHLISDYTDSFSWHINREKNLIKTPALTIQSNEKYLCNILCAQQIQDFAERN